MFVDYYGCSKHMTCGRTFFCYRTALVCCYNRIAVELPEKLQRKGLRKLISIYVKRRFKGKVLQ